MILFFYILKEFFKYVIGLLILCLFLFNITDLLQKTSRFFGDNKVEIWTVIQYYSFKVPDQITQILPIAALISSVVTMVLLSRTNEITAMRAAGMGPLKIAKPMIAGGIILSLVAVLVGEFVAPESNKRMRLVRHSIYGGGPSNLPLSHWYRQGDILYTFDNFDVLSEELMGVKIIHMGEHFRPTRTIEAEFAKYEYIQKEWQLHNVKIYTFSPYGTILAQRKQDTLLSHFPIDPKRLEQDRRTGLEMAIKELYSLVSRGKASGLNVTNYEVDLHVKIAFYFAAFIVSLLGLKFGFRSERTMETARSVAIALGIGISYWLILNVGQALGKRGTIPPMLSAWLANIIIFSVVLREIWKTQKV